MTLYLLDTDTCSYIMKRSHQNILDRLRSTPVEDVVISVITEAELLYGLQLSKKQKQDRAAFEAFIKHLSVRDWTLSAARHYAEIRASLKTTGQMIGSNDLLIAAHARSLDATIVTNNDREFRRVQDLSVENWT